MAVRRQSKISMMDSIGQKVQKGIEVFGKAEALSLFGEARLDMVTPVSRQHDLITHLPCLCRVQAASQS